MEKIKIYKCIREKISLDEASLDIDNLIDILYCVEKSICEEYEKSYGEMCDGKEGNVRLYKGY